MLQAKLCMPHIGENIIRRMRVEETLRRLPNYQFAFISAPAGYGKTTAVADYLTREKLKYAWFSVDGTDNDPIRFWKYLIESVSPYIDKSEMEQITLSAELIASHIPVDYLIGIIEKVPERFVLVIDDYHLIENDVVSQSVEHFVKYLPQNVSLIILSRKEPEHMLAALRARGVALSLGERDIAFDSDETSEFFIQKGFRLTEQEIDAVNTRTEGWAAGLVAASFSFEGGESVPEAIRAFSGGDRNIESFLSNEVFERWPAEVREFLVSTAFLDRLSGPLCDAVIGGSTGATLLKALSKSNSFVIPLDSAGGWYRYHHLFQDFLQNRLELIDAEKRNQLYHRAGEWCLKKGLTRDGINWLIRAKEYEKAFPLVMESWFELSRDSEFLQWRKWIDAIPPAVYRDSNTVYTAYSWVLSMQNDLDGAAIWTQKSRDCFERLKDTLEKEQRDYLEAHVLFAEANMAFWELNPERMIDRMRLIGKLKIKTLVVLGEMNWDKPNLLKTAYGFCGRLNKIEQCIPALNGLDSFIGDYSAYFAVSIAEYYYERNALREMEAVLTDHMGRIIGMKFPGVIVPCFIVLAKRNMAKGNVRRAFETVAEARKLLGEKSGSLWKYFLDVFEARLHLSVGDTKSALKLIDTEKLGLYDSLTAVRESEYIVWARCLMSENKLEEALTLLNRLTDFARKENQLSSEVELLCLTAICRAQSGDYLKAMRALEQALDLGEPEGYTRSFVDEGEPMAKLLSKYRVMSRSFEELTHTAYAKRLLRLTNEYAGLIDAAKKDGESSDAPFEAGLLSEREIEMLRLLAGKHSNEEIATALIISVSAVKQYNSRIYDKLGVRNRQEATVKAKALGLIE